MNLHGHMCMSFLQATGDKSAISSQAVCARYQYDYIYKEINC